MLSQFNFKLRLILAIAMVLSLSGLASAQKGGKGGGKKGDGSSNLPPVRYQVRFYDLPSLEARIVSDFSRNGTVVGHFYTYPMADLVQFHAYLFDPQINAQSAVDLNDVVAGIPETFVIALATGVNWQGDIAATLSPSDDTSIRRGCILYMNATDAAGNLQPTLIQVPDAQFGTYTWARDINDWGDVVGVYKRLDGTYGAYMYNSGVYGQEPSYGPIDMGISMPGFEVRINNQRQIAGMLTNGNAFRYSILTDDLEEIRPPSDSTGTYSWSNVFGINDSGVLVGGQSATKYRGGGKVTLDPCRYGNRLEVFPTDKGKDGTDINASGDFIVSSYGQLYMDDFGYLDIETLLDPNDANTSIAIDGWAIYKRLTDRMRTDANDQSGFPPIAGHVLVSGDGSDVRNFILVPVAPN